MSISSRNRMPSNENNYCTDLGVSTLVANYATPSTSRDATSKPRRNFPAKSKWGNRTIKQSDLEIHGSTDVVLSGLLAEAHKFLLPKSSYDRKLKAIWEDFIDFCNAHKLVALPAS